MAINSLEPGQLELPDFLPPGVEPSLGDLEAALTYTQSDVANLQGDVADMMAWKSSLVAAPVEYMPPTPWTDIKIWRQVLPVIPPLEVVEGMIPGTEIKTKLLPGQIPGEMPGLPSPVQFIRGVLPFLVPPEVLTVEEAAFVRALPPYLEDVSSHITNIYGNIDIVQSDIGSLQRDVEDLERLPPRVSNLESKASSIERNISSIEGDIGSIQNTIDYIRPLAEETPALRSDVNTLENDISIIISDLVSIQGDIDGLRESITYVETELFAPLESSVASLGISVGTLQTDVTTLDNTINAPGGILERIVTMETQLATVTEVKEGVLIPKIPAEYIAEAEVRTHDFLSFVPLDELFTGLTRNNTFCNNLADAVENISDGASVLTDDVKALAAEVAGLAVAVGEGVSIGAVIAEIDYTVDPLKAQIAALAAEIEAVAVLPTDKADWLDLAGFQSAVADLIPPGLSLPTTPTGWMDLPGFPILPTDFPTLEDIRAEIAAQIDAIVIPDFPTLEDIRDEIAAQMVDIPGLSSIIDYATDLDSVLISGGSLLKSAGANLTKVNTDSLSNMDLAGDSIQAVIDEYEAIEFPASFIGDNLIHAINMVVNLVNAVGYLGSVVNTIRGGFDVVGSDIGGVGALLENVPEPPLLPTLL